MKKLINIIILVVILFSIGLAKEIDPTDVITFLSPRSLYVYVKGASLYTDPIPGAYFSGKAHKFTPILGVGYHLIKFSSTSNLNFEFDYFTANYDFYLAGTRSVDFYNFRIDFECAIFPKSFIIGHTGMGISLLKYGRCGDFMQEDEFLLNFELGLKIPFSKKLLLRTDLSFYSIPGDSYMDYEYYYDEYYDDGEHIATTVSVGLELHF